MDPEALSIAFLPRLIRTITRQGIVIAHVHYYETFLEPLFDTGQRRIEVAYDPRDLSRILIETPQGPRALRYRNLTNPPVSLWELRAARHALRVAGRASIDEVALFSARAANQALVANAKSETRRRLRDIVRQARHKEQSPIRSIAIAGDDIPAESDASEDTVLDGEFKVVIEPW